MTIGGTSIITRGLGYAQKIITRGYGGKYQSQGSGKKKGPIYRGREIKGRLELKIYSPVEFLNRITKTLKNSIDKQMTYQLNIKQGIIKTLKLYYSIENHIVKVNETIYNFSADVLNYRNIKTKIDKQRLIRILKAL